MSPVQDWNARNAPFAATHRSPQRTVCRKAVDDRHAAVAVDMAALHADGRIPGVSVSGLLYDVSTGSVSTVGTAGSPRIRGDPDDHVGQFAWFIREGWTRGGSPSCFG